MAQWLGMPMPYMLGALVTTATLVIALPHRLPAGAGFTPRMREIFVAIVAVMIGGAFTSDQITAFSTLWLSALAVLLFILVCIGANYVLMRRIGGYDPVTAFFAGMPAGLVDATIMGEKAGGDVPIIAAQQFIRIILVIVSVPFLFQIATGEVVGSAAGATAADRLAASGLDWVLHGIAAVVGLFLARALRFPAAFFIGPLIGSAALHIALPATGQLPFWLMALAQWIVGTGLGVRFIGFEPAMLLRCFWLGLVSLVLLGAITIVFALGLMGPLGQSFPVMFLSFAPGGMSEMGLIALSLAISPAVVTLHHVLRIFVTLFLAGLLMKYAFSPKSPVEAEQRKS